MKTKKLNLDESLFDDDITNFQTFDDSNFTHWVDTPDIPGYQILEIDDDFSPPAYMPQVSESPIPGPTVGPNVGVADMLISAINDEWETIKFYNSLIATLKSTSPGNPVYESMIDVINHINEEENHHVGELQLLLKQISPNAEAINHGEEEAQEKLGFVNGRLPVQMHESASVNKDNPNAVDETCTIINIDDEM